MADPAAVAPPARTGLVGQFIAFLEAYGVVGLAVAFVIGQAVTRLVNALVVDVVNPVVLAFVPGGNWREAVYDPPFFGPILWGHALGELVNFLIVALVVFLFAKFALRREAVKKI